MQLKLSPELPGASVEVLADSEPPLQRQSA
jgi:hypothetical protein